MSTKFLSPGWRMPKNANQSKSTNYSLDFIPNDVINVSGFSTALSNVNNGTRLSDNNLPFSWSVWFKSRNSSNSQGEIAGYGQSQRNGIRIHNNVFRSNYTSDLPGTTTINQNVWYHGVVTYDGTTRKIYVNGSLDASDTPSSAAISNQPLTIGVYPGGSSSFNGELNELCYFDYALSESQITTLYGTGSAIGNPMALPSSPVAYYPLGESAGGFVGGTGTWLTENNAIGDYVFNFYSPNIIDTGTSLTITRDLTLSGWVKFTSTSSGGSTVISKHITANAQPYYTYRLYIESNKAKFRIGISTATFITGSTDINDGEWHHILGTYDGSNINLYVDGVSDATAVSVSGDLNTSVRKTTIGGVINGDTNTLIPTTVFNGELSNTQIFNTALTGPEVETLYNYGSPIRTLANIPQSSNLKAWYKLDATEIYNSTSTEWSVDNNQNPSAYPSSLYFDGNDYIDCGATVQQPTTNYSVSCWVKFTTIASASTGIVGNFQGSIVPQRGYAITHQNGTPFQFWADGTASSNAARVQGITNPVANVWYNIVGTYDGANVKIYVNNVLENTVSYSATPATTNQNLKIGRWYGNIDDYYTNGSISNVSIWNAALTDGTGGTLNQIETLYNNGTPLADMSSFSSLVSWWKLNNTTTGIEDSKGSNNGTNNGATEYAGFVNTLAGDSTGMSQSNLVQSDLQTVAPYSKYALNFDGNDSISCGSSSNLQFQPTSDSFSLSAWIKIDSLDGNAISNFMAYREWNTAPYEGYNFGVRTVGGNNVLEFTMYSNGASNKFRSVSNLSYNTWYYATLTYDYTQSPVASKYKIYLNGVSQSVTTVSASTLSSFTYASNFRIGAAGSSGIDLESFFDGSISNVSVWNAALTSSQVREIYNEGLPSNLHNFSGTAPVAWWQLGENSSFNGNDWICADEIGSSNGESDGMGVDALTNGVGTTANGSSTGMSEGSLVGDAPYSTGNAISSGMAVQAFDSETPPNVISGRSEDVPS